MINKAFIPLLTPQERIFALQAGEITLFDLAMYEACKNEPYDFLFMSLPFNEALDWSIRMAKSSVDRVIKSKLAMYRFINEAEDGVISYDSSEMGFDDLTTACGIAIKAQLNK